MTLSTIVRWLDAHALSIALYLGLTAAILRAAHAMLARILAPYPRARAFVEAVAAMAPDVLRFLGQAYALLTGRALPSTGTPPAPPTPLPLADAAGKEGAAVVSETRGFDPAQRQTIAPDVVAEAQRITRESERGSVDLRTLGAIVMVLAVGAPMGALIAGCPRLPPVSGCQPEAQTCIADSPHVCSASQRWHRAGDLSCSAVGGQCLVAGGRAFCAPLTDGGVR